MSNKDKLEGLEGPSIRTRPGNNRPSVPVPSDNPGPPSSEDTTVSIPNSIPGPSQVPRPSEPLSIPGPSHVPNASEPISIPGPSTIRNRPQNVPRSNREVPGIVPPPSNIRRSESYLLSMRTGPPRPIRPQRPPRLNDRPANEPDDPTPTVSRPRSRSLTRRIRRFFSRRFHPNIGRHRSGEDSRIIFDDHHINDDDEERERAPPPPPLGERVRYREFPTSTYNYLLMYDPVLPYRTVNDTCSVWSRSEEDLPHLKSVDEDVPSIDDCEADFEAAFADNFESTVDSLTDNWPGISDLAIDPVAGGEERADPVAEGEEEKTEDVERIANSVAEDISENIKNKVCHRGSPC